MLMTLQDQTSCTKLSESTLYNHHILTILWCEKARKHMCVTDRHDMTSAVKVALNPNTTNQTDHPLGDSMSFCKRNFT